MFPMKQKEFLTWLKSPERLDLLGNIIDLSNERVPGEYAGDKAEYITKLFTDCFGGNANNKKIILTQKSPLADEFGFFDNNPKGHFVKSLEISNVSSDVKFHDFSVNNMKIHSSSGKITLDNLIIYELELAPTVSGLTIENCCIGTMKFRYGNSVHDLEVKGGGVCNLSLPSPHEPNPFSGSVNFRRDVDLPLKSGFLLHGPQAYRNMRSHMSKLENAPMASLFHRLEHLIERENSAYFDRIIGATYRIFSGYGGNYPFDIAWGSC